jgi:two-component system, response regulator YesN
MKVLIIDDETHVREGIKLLADFESTNTTEIFEAENGKIAKEIIKRERPQIIFTDMMMPELDGRELLKWIKSEKLTSKIIVITGYEDYQFMREAIQNGASDYLLKPIDPDSLNETFLKATSEWNREEAQRKESLNYLRKLHEILPFYRDQQLSNAIVGNPYDKNLLVKLESTIENNVQVSIIKLRNLEAINGIWPEDLCYFAILNVANELLHDLKVGIAFKNIYSKQEICLVYWGNDCLNFLIKLTEILTNIVPFQIHISSSRRYEIDEMNEAYGESKRVMSEYNLLETLKYPIYSLENIREYKKINFVELLKLLDQMMEKHDITIFDEVINRLTSQIKEQYYFSYSQLETWDQEFNLLLTRWVNTNTIQNFHQISIDTYWNIKGQFDLKEYLLAQRDSVYSLLNQISRPNKEINIIEEIASYIQINYSEEISLQEFSEKFYLSREYISRKFKQIYGENLSDFIVRIRINKAKELLKFPNLKIYEIAGKIGYQDDKYFRKIFKKIVGMTPNEYRKEFELKKIEIHL